MHERHKQTEKQRYNVSIIRSSTFNHQKSEAVMNFAIVSSPLKKGLQVALSLLLGVALLGSNAAYAFGGLCVHPTGAGNCFTSIQEAVDAANDDDQILIRSGKYVEQVTIVGKSLTLVGRRGAVIQAPEAMEDTLTPIY